MEAFLLIKDSITLYKDGFKGKHSCSPATEGRFGVKYAAHHSRMFLHGLVSVVEALRRTVRCSIIKESFAKSGFYPYSPNVILAKCTADISVEERWHILSVIPDLAKILLSKGEIESLGSAIMIIILRITTAYRVAAG